MAVIERTGGYACGACGGSRERHPSTVCVSDAALLQALEPRRAGNPRLLALVCAAPFLLAGALARALPAELRWLLALVGVFTALGVLARDQRIQRRTIRRRTFEIEQRIIGLAYQNDGVLREQEVSTRLRISLVEARAVLEDLVRQDRAIAYGQGRQVSEFRFGEARRTRAIRARRGAEAGGSAGERS